MKYLVLSILFASLLFAENDPISIIDTREDGMWLIFSNTPPNWILEQTADLYTWHHILTGSTTNSIIEFRIKSGMEAIFFRVRPK